MSSAAQVYVTRTWRRETPDAWRALLHRTAAPAENTSWLHLRWHPGYAAPGRPQAEAECVERFVLYQVIPARFTPVFFEQPHIGWLGMTDGSTRPRFELIWDLLDSNQKAIYRETGRYAQPIWCLQGPGGGQPWRYSRAEQLLAHIRDLPPAPIPPGELAPCPLDRRTLAALDMRDRFRRWEFLSDMMARTGTHVEQDEAEAMRAARREFDAWSEERMRASLDEFTRAQKAAAVDELRALTPLTTREDRRAAAKAAPHLVPDLARARESFIQTGHTRRGLLS